MGVGAASAAERGARLGPRGRAAVPPTGLRAGRPAQLLPRPPPAPIDAHSSPGWLHGPRARRRVATSTGCAWLRECRWWSLAPLGSWARWGLPSALFCCRGSAARHAIRRLLQQAGHAACLADEREHPPSCMPPTRLSPRLLNPSARPLHQVSVHIKGASECFECQPKPTPKTFPVSAGAGLVHILSRGMLGALLCQQPLPPTSPVPPTPARPQALSPACAGLPTRAGVHAAQHTRQAHPLRGVGQGDAVPAAQPRLPHVCNRLARRGGLGVEGREGGREGRREGGVQQLDTCSAGLWRSAGMACRCTRPVGHKQH